MLYLTNTLSGQKEPFTVETLPVRMYVCGLTPKNEPHLGHARLFIANDVIRRYLEYRGMPVRYVQNFTDIDDKTIAAALREQISPAEVARRYMDGYFRDMDALAVRRADIFTYVTEFIPNIITFIEGLIASGHAYAAAGTDDGQDVYFATSSFPAYGHLSGRNEEAMLAGARIEADERKQDPRDFALWKAAKPGEPWWESPWGKGRPGWHIECSTMAMETLGEQIDIHGGGTDLIFPHHENEIAQSEARTGVHPFARYWVHTGLLQLGDEKMAHSGAFVSIRSILETVPAPAFRLYLAAQSYRTQFTYLEEQVQATIRRWRRWVAVRAKAVEIAGDAVPATPDPFAGLRAEFIAVMDDDINTSRGTGVIDDLVKQLNDQLAKGPKKADRALIAAGLHLLDELNGVLGIALDAGRDIRRELATETIAAIDALVARRSAARAAKDWAAADVLRQELDDHYGVIVKDSPVGSTWEVR